MMKTIPRKKPVMPNSIIRFAARQLRFSIFIVVAFFSMSHAFAANAGAETVKAKEIKHPEGAVIFSIPKHWSEEYDLEGNGIYYENGKNTTKLRVNVITVNLPIPVTANSGAKALCILKDMKPTEIENLPNGNALARLIERTTEEGLPTTNYRWYVAHPIPPQHVRMATFSFTFPSSLEESPKTVAELQFLEGSIRNTQFYLPQDL
ncbi:MAG: hypothetical protein Q8K43_03765 [Sulfurimicrobium sp.]|nr:hypothetical protein [Sulfurimicrobium sp.]MDP1896984.1 hypothetical protein [Sulfurimicrobium sp.]MDP3687875.1 hypothetical protein [Sulfurimicrobium sp.]